MFSRLWPGSVICRTGVVRDEVARAEGVGVIDCEGTSPSGGAAYADLGEGCTTDAGEPERAGISKAPDSRAALYPFVYCA